MSFAACSATVLLPLHDPQEEWQRRMDMLRDSREFIYASMYFLQHDRFGEAYIAALEAACARGVGVGLLIDGFGQKLAGALMTPAQKRDIRTALQRLRGAGANVRFYRCPSALMRTLGSGMHIKIQLSEKGGALFGSGNVSFTSYDKWREFTTYVEGPLVARLLQEFPAYGMAVQAHHLQALQTARPGGHSLSYLSYDPTRDAHPLNPLRLRGPNPLTDALAARIDAARESLSLTSLYYKPAPILRDAVLRAARRGVRVEIFHCHRDALGPSVVPWIPAYLHYGPLLEAGVHIYENTRGEHAKLLLIDDREAYWGSYNLEYMAHDRLAEAMLCSQEELMLQALRKAFAARRTEAANIRILPEHLRLPAPLRRKVNFFRPFERWL